jgi:hypothetical protein
MGLFDRFRSKASSVEVKPPVNVEKPKDNAIRDAKGQIVGFENIPAISLKTAREYVTSQYKMLAEELEDLRKSGIPNMQPMIEANAAKAAEVKKFQDAIDATLENPTAREQIHEGRDIAVANPYFSLETVGIAPMEAANDNASEKPSVEDLESELSGMKSSRDALVSTQKSLEAQRDEIMRGLHGMHAGEELTGSLSQMYKEAQPEVYGHSNEEVYGKDEVKRADDLEKSAYQMADATRQKKSETGVSEKLREVLDQLDDVTEAVATINKNIERKQVNVDFLRKNTAPAESKREAA